MPDNPTKQQIKDAIEAACRGEPDAFLGLLHPQVEVHEPSYLPFGGHYRGIDSVVPVIVEVSKLIDLDTLSLQSITADEDRVVVLETVSLTGNGQKVKVIEHWQLEDGLAREIDVFWSSLPPGPRPSSSR